MVLVFAWKQSNRPTIRSRTNVHYLVFHLTIADTITCFITLPMETVWRATVGVSRVREFCNISVCVCSGTVATCCARP